MNDGLTADATTAAAIRSPTRSAPTYSPPREDATVRPLPRNSRLLTMVTATPASCIRANAVGCGCHSSGSTSLSQSSEMSSFSVPGIRLVKPTSPCVPGVSPVPSEVRLVAVVDGTPAVPVSLPSSSAARNGATCRWRWIRRAPSPSTRKTTYDGASGSSRLRRCLADRPAERGGHRRDDVAEGPAGVRRLDERLRHDAVTAGHACVRADSCSAKDSSPPTASAPSAAAETRSEKSSADRTPV